MQIAICPGSYDPVTYGHMNIIERSARLFDKLIVTVMVNREKKTWFTTEERAELLRVSTAHLPNVEVATHYGLVAEYARQRGASVLVKGLRAVTDFEYEFQMALINRELNRDLETMFITTDSKFMFLSSSAVREVATFGGELSDFVPQHVEQAIKARLGGAQKQEG